jgi:hypothetical protein
MPHCFFSCHAPKHRSADRETDAWRTPTDWLRSMKGLLHPQRFLTFQDLRRLRTIRQFWSARVFANHTIRHLNNMHMLANLYTSDASRRFFGDLVLKCFSDIGVQQAVPVIHDTSCKPVYIICRDRRPTPLLISRKMSAGALRLKGFGFPDFSLRRRICIAAA